METKTCRDMSLEELTREYAYISRRCKDMYARKSELEKEIDRRFENGELGKEDENEYYSEK